MSEIKSYKDLVVWQKGIDLVVDVYRVLSNFPVEERFALAAQIRRSAVSVPSNLAEGQSRRHSAEFKQFIHISLGSLAELDTQFIIAKRLAYITEEELSLISGKIMELQKMLFALIKKLPYAH